jgi:phosphohistidine phosphatase
MRKLVLLRHASAGDGIGKPDFDRELTQEGRKEAQTMGRWLLRRSIHPDTVVSSPAPRALATAMLACEMISVDRDAIVTDPALYDCTPTTLLRRVARMPGRVVLVVGHNPSLEQAALHLTGDEDLAVRGLARAGVVVMELPDDWDDLGAKTASSWIVADPGVVV